MKFNLKIATILVLFSNVINAQVPSGSKVLFSPNEYNRPSGEISLKNEATRGNDWVVYADRDNVQTYTKPDGKENFKIINFLEPFFVIEEKGDFVRLVKYDVTIFRSDNKSARKILNTAVLMGWAEKRKLLLWKHALVTPQGFTIKALSIINDKNALMNPGKFIRNGNIVKIYNSPDLHDLNENEILMFQFLFIYKTSDDNNNYLIGKSFQTSTSSIKGEILGWAPKSIVQKWEARLCLEPNWDILAANERRATGVKATLWRNDVEVLSVMKGNKTEGLWQDDPYEVRAEPEWKRFPVLTVFPHQIIETGLITKIFDKEGNQSIQTADQLATEKKYNALRENMRKINVVFVMDGGSTMNGFYDPILNSIQKTIDLVVERKNNTYQWGGVIYRDHVEESCPMGPRNVEKIDLSSNTSPLLDFFKEASQDSKECNDKERPQAVFLGLEKALRMMTEHRDETNIIILIGNTGNRMPDTKGPSFEQISKLIVETETRLLVFQVNNAADKSYDDFIRQSHKLISTSAKSISEKIRLNNPKIAGKVVEPKYVQFEDKNFYHLDYPTTSPLPGFVIFPDKGSPMSAIDLEKGIGKLIQETNDELENRLREIDAKLTGVGERNVKTLNAAVIYYLSKLGTDVNSAEVIKQYTEVNYQFFIKAYTTLEVKGMKYPLFKYILFVDEDEYADLKKVLEKVVRDETGNQLRENLVEVYKELILTYMGGKHDREVLNTPLSTIMEKITGMPSRSDFMKKYSVSDLENHKMVTDQVLTELMIEMKRKLAQLKQIRIENKSSFMNNDNRYYWLPESVLP